MKAKDTKTAITVGQRAMGAQAGATNLAWGWGVRDYFKGRSSFLGV